MTRVGTLLLLGWLVVPGLATAQAPATTQKKPPAPRSPATARGLTNQDVIKLAGAGLGDDVILTAIRQAEQRSFDLRPEGLIALKQGKVSDAVIREMQRIAAGGSSSEPAPTVVAVTAPTEPTPPTPPARLAPGTELRFTLTKSLTSETAKVGDRVDFAAVADVVVGDQVVIKKGAAAHGRIVAATRQLLTRGGRLELVMEGVEDAKGDSIPLRGGQNFQADGRTAGIRGREAEVMAGAEVAAVVVEGGRAVAVVAPASSTTPAPSEPAGAGRTPSALPPVAGPSATGATPVTTTAATAAPVSMPTSPSTSAPTTTPAALAPGATLSPESLPGQTSQQREQIERDLKTMYSLSSTAIFDRAKVNRVGGVYAVRADGIQGEVAIQSGTAPTYIVDGKIRASADSGAGEFLNNVLTGRKREEARIFKRDDRVYITGIRALRDGLEVAIMSVETFPIIDQGRTRQMSYKGELFFTREIRALAARGFPVVSDAAAMKRMIDDFIVSEEEASKPKTIELGQSVEQVEAAFGKPINVIKLGDRVIYAYKDLKVTFTNGKVSDVQ